MTETNLSMQVIRLRVQGPERSGELRLPLEIIMRINDTYLGL